MEPKVVKGAFVFLCYRNRRASKEKYRLILRQTICYENCCKLNYFGKEYEMERCCY